MVVALTVSAVSGLLLLVLILLLRVEQGKGERVLLSRIRSHLDSGVLMLERSLHTFFHFIGSRVIRLSIHYLIHKCLDSLITLLHRLQAALAHLQLRNRYLVKAVTKSKDLESHLEQLSQHKKDTSLSKRERQARTQQ